VRQAVPAHVPRSPGTYGAIHAGAPRRNLSPRNVFETPAEEDGPQPQMCRIVSAVAQGLLPVLVGLLGGGKRKVNLFRTRRIQGRIEDVSRE